MTISLENAVAYDVETIVNVFTLSAEALHNDTVATWEISDRRNDAPQIIQWFNYLQAHQIPMIGFYSEHFDYLVCHWLWQNPQATAAQLYAKAQEIIKSNNRFAHMIWPRDRFAPQIDLFKIHHFDNIAKRTSLKALEINMRSPFVLDMPVKHDVPVSPEDIDRLVIPYNRYDVNQTKKFAHYSMDAIEFRIGQIDEYGIDVLNYNDVKIGVKLLEKRLGDDICYDRSSGRKQPRQTPRWRIPLADIIFPYIRFQNPEFQRVLEFMRDQTLTPDDLDTDALASDTAPTLKTKGVFTKLHAEVGGLTFHFGTGGVHASVSGQRFYSDSQYVIRDIDVAALYPSIAIVNQLAPAHLGEAFTQEYGKIPIERAQHAKGTYKNGALKLAANGPWGQSNNKYSIFFDPQYAMTIPINGQLMLCMLVEWLITVPTLTLIQANTDGITYRIDRRYEPQAAAICKQWEAFTCLKLEDADYSRMWIRDVNNYIAEDTKGKLKQKGAYWHPDPFDYANSISRASPPCWYKDLGNIASTRAAVAAMVHGIDPATFLLCHTDPFDFMCRVKVEKGSHLYLGGQPVQQTFRYYVARQGAPLVKRSPPPDGAIMGAFKRKPKVTQAEYDRVMSANGGAWDASVCTGNQSRYDVRETAIQAGWQIADCCDASRFRFDNLNYDWYLAEARKLII